MPFATQHNGGKTQLGLNTTAAQFPFIDYMRACSTDWSNRTGTKANWIVDPTLRDANGQPTGVTGGSAGYYTSIKIPSSASRSNHYVMKWDGAGTFIAPGGTVTGGSLTSGTGGGRITFDPTPDANFTRTLFVTISSLSASPDHIRNIRVCHADDEADLDAGKIFQTQFKNRIADLGVGVIRFMDWTYTNICRITKWSDRKPTSYWSWVLPEWRAAFQSPSGLTTGGTGTAFTLAFPGFTLVDKAIVQVYFDRSQAGACTLNVNSTGDINIISHNSVPLSSGGNSLIVGNASNSWATLVYDAGLNAWIKYGGDAAFGNNYPGFVNGAPFDVMLRLCAETGTHPWLNIPFLSDDLNDFCPNLAAYARDWISTNNVPWMKPFFEGQNEIFNGFASFHANGYASAKQGIINGAPWPSGVQSATTYNVTAVAVNGSDAAKTDIIFSAAPAVQVGGLVNGNNFGGMGSGWGSSGTLFTAYVTAVNVGGNPNKITVNKQYAGAYTSGGTIVANLVDFEDWYGTHISKIGQAVSAAFGNDRTKYEVVCGVQTANGSTSGGCNSSNTRLASYSSVWAGGSAAYNWVTAICTAQYFTPSDYNTANETTDIANWASVQGTGYISGTALHMSTYSIGSGFSAGQEINGYGIVVGTKIVSGSGADYVVDTSQTYASAGAPAAIYGGDTATRRSTEKAYIATNLTGAGSFNIPKAYTFFQNWANWANGFGVKKMFGYEGGYSPDFPSASGSTLTAQFRQATKYCPDLVIQLSNVYREFCGQGTTISYPSGFVASFPSCYFFVGNQPSDYAWAVLETIYQANTPQYDAIRLFNAGKSRLVVST
ncbi:hypothetical protein XI06_15095 [Bradyrhizobium sp. CCBAU 11434]|uniref:hypothetical protein n=1 Tax=Bradyrhizobium sp. CCBAU 11434 TaxID=1630885 RepID=UPI002305E90C|nr:hypothetical protein [Bradyrhizobium sp. CCBAU 11434]MDA9521634.1 hypothetical protein [Bradyrhizobium sp. CCBAU 11434]